MNLLIDLDIVLFKGLFVCKDKYYEGLRACEWMVDRIRDRFGNPGYTLVLTGKNNFRKQISSEYKANRKPESRPKYLHDARNYFIKYHPTVIADGMEADDYIGIHHNDKTIICSTDKDLLMLGGKYYNFHRDELIEVEDPLFYFFKQMIQGDAADNVKGIPGLGEVKATKLLKDKSNEERKEIVESLYQEHFGEDWFRLYDINSRLLWIIRDPKKEYYHYI
jgi:5'-3' exonuclease